MPKLKVKSCDDCGLTFTKNSGLESHMENIHAKEKLHKCDTCEKSFYLNWRLKKHVLMHSKKPIFCHYYNNGNNCPYQDIGCMFLHERAGLCIFRNCKKVLCQYQHEEEEGCKEIVDVSEADEDQEEFEENQENDVKMH